MSPRSPRGSQSCAPDEPVRLDSRRRWDRANPKKRAAHHALRNALRRGEVQPQPCEICGAPAHGHHPDYDAPLVVKWLCPRHHKAEHRAEAARRAAV